MKIAYWLICGLFLQTAAQANEVALNASQAKTLGITSAPLSAKQQGELAGIPAQVVIPSNQLFIISAPLPAMIEQTMVGVGDSVRKGQLMATLQSPALAETQRGFLQSATQAELAKENLARDEQLWKDGIISESRYRSTHSAYREANAIYAERRQALKLSGLSDSAIEKLHVEGALSSQLNISSPIDGIVLEKTASAGQRLDAAIPLFKVAKLEPLALEIQAPLSSTHALKVGARVTVPAYGAKGRLTAIGRSLSGENQTILMRAIIQEGARNLRPGQFVEASIDTNGGTLDQWNIPNSALAHIGNKTLIFIETSKGFRSEPVTVMYEGATNSVVTCKLKGDERIAVSGVSALKARLLGIGGQ